jgi:hypothetical protein
MYINNHAYFHNIWLLNYANTAEISSINEECAGIVNHAESENREIKSQRRSIRGMLSVMHRFMIYSKRQNFWST